MSVHLPRIGPGRTSGNEIELSKHAAHHLVRLAFDTQAIDLAHDLCQRRFDVADRALRVELTLSIQAALAPDEFFAIKV